MIKKLWYKLCYNKWCRQLRHSLFGHTWLFVDWLPSTYHRDFPTRNLDYAIVWVRFQRCSCALYMRAWSTYLENGEVIDNF